MKKEPAKQCMNGEPTHLYHKVDYVSTGDVLMVCSKCGDAFKVNLTSL